MNHASFAGGWQETVKMSINSAKRWYVLHRGCIFALFTDYIYAKKGHPVVFFFFYSKGYVDVTRI